MAWHSHSGSLSVLPSNAGLIGGQRHVNREDAAGSWHVADLNVTTVRLHRLARNRQAEAEAGSIGPAPVSKSQEQIPLAGREAAAFVLDLDDQALALWMYP